MKTKIKQRYFLIAVMVLAISFTSCKDDDDDTTVMSKTIADIVVSDNRFTILEKALTKTDLAGALATKTGSFTVFAPTDAAFTAFLSSAGFSKIEDVPNDVLKPILLYHVIGAKVMSSAVTTGYASTISPVDNDKYLSVYIEKNSGVKINNSAMVTIADVMADNGVIHVIDKVITPMSVGELVAVNPDLSSLAGAVVSQNLLNTLKDKNGTFTVFAPNNAAFAKYSTLPSDVTSLLLYHVIGSKNYSSGLATGYYNSLSKFGEYHVSMKIITTPEVKINNSAKVVKADITGINGVIHIIDDVIFQPSVVAIAQHNPNFSILVQAVIKAGLVETLSGNGPFTVFAPTNDAFNALFATLKVSGIEALTKEQLIPILKYHVVQANARSTDLTSGKVSTLNGQIDVNVGTTVTINQTTKVVATDVQGINGIVHVIDQVLIPQ